MSTELQLEQLVNSYFEKTKDSLSLNNLVDLIQENLSLIQSLRERRKKQEKEPKSITVKMPTIRISEKMWGRAGTEDREILNSMLGGIIARGGTLSEKIRLINEFLNSPPSDDANISEILSHIMFLDTLTNIMIHFNYSAAGFTFEGFLAALLEGEQVPAGTSGIQDIIDNDQNPVSLKLVSEKNPEVKGSYADLIGHFTDPSKESPYITDSDTGKIVANPQYVKKAGSAGSMKYVIALKSWNEEELGNAQGQLNGTIKFYEFDFNAESFMKAMLSTEQNKGLLLLPAVLGEDELEFEEIFNPLNAPEGETFKSLDAPSKKLYNAVMSEFVPSAAKEFFSDLEIVEKSRTKAGKITNRLVQKGTDKVPRIQHPQTRGLDPRFKKAAGYKEKGFLSLGQSVSLLRTALNEGEKVFWDLIKETSGIHGGFATTFRVHHRHYRQNYEDGVGFLGQVRIGNEAITELANKYADVLEQQIFDIYSSLEELSANLNGYFIGAEKKKGLEAIKTAEKIKSETQELIKTKTI